MNANQSQKKEIIIGSNTNTPLTVHRMGYGTMRLTGPSIWGEPADRPQAIQILRRAVDQGVNYIDTADYYGPDVTNPLIVEALYPYPDNLIIGTKVGAKRGPDKSWPAYTSPENLRISVEKNLKELRLEQIPVVHFRMSVGHNPVPFEESVEAMFELQKEGKILHLGLSNVSLAELQWALTRGKIGTVQNLYSYTHRNTFTGPIGVTRGGEEVLKTCEENQIPLIPFFSLITSLPKKAAKIKQLATKYQVTEAQLNLAWSLHKSEWMLPIPGTSSLAHLEENLAAIAIELAPEDMAWLEQQD